MAVLGAFEYRFELDGAEVEWELIDAVLDEALFELPMASFDVLTPGPLPANIVGKDLRFELSRADTPSDAPLLRVGKVVRAEAMQRVDARRFRARVHVSNRGYLLGLARRCRIFHEHTASDIIKKVCGEGAVDAGEVKSTSHQRDYTTQYFETDLDFVRRLCEDYGLLLRWSPDAKDKLYVAPPGGKEAESVGRFALVLGDDAPTFQSEFVRAFVQESRLAVDRVQVASWDPKRKKDTVAKVAVPGAKQGFQAQVVDHAPAGVRGIAWGMMPDEAAAKAMVTTDDAATEFHRGVSNVRALTAGRAFELDDETDSGRGGKYCVTRVQHRVTLTDVPGESADRALVYENEFECVLDPFPPRPPRATPRPAALAPVIGLVTTIPHQTPSKLGTLEVMVKFPTFAAPNDQVWVRVAQPFAGNGHGIQFLPHINDEVVVQFLDADPDRPVVMGSLYNGADAPPAAIPGQHTRNVIRAMPYHQGAQFDGPDELFFEEDASRRIVGINAAEDHVVEVGNDNLQHTVRDRVTNVDRDDKHTVKGAMTVEVTKDRTATVKGGDKTTVEKNHELVVKQGAKTTVYKKLVISADEGIELQCGDNSVVITPSGITLSISSGAKVELKPSGVTVESGMGAKVELVGPMVNLN